MQWSQASLGRVFILRLTDGDRLPDCLEAFAAERGLKQAFCAMLGGIGSGRLIVGPEDGDASPAIALQHVLAGVHEAAALGTIFPDEEGAPRLHMHGAMGRQGETRTGCLRAGVEVWKIGEVIILELTGAELCRRRDPATGFEMLSLD